MVFSFARDVRRELVQAFPKHPVERRERMDDIGENLQRRPQLDGEHELADDLACAGCDHCRADQHPALTIGDELERATVKVMDVAARGLSRIGAGDDAVDASGPRGNRKRR
jgi:hypothetical protein